jgi:hypothetical protein
LIRIKPAQLDAKKVIKRLSDYSKEVQTQAALVVADYTLKVHGEAVKSIQSIRSKGNERPDGSYASKPGNPPNTDTGTLVKSLNVEVDLNKATGKVYSKLKYALWLEVGTLNIEKRPFLAPALEKFYVKFIDAIKKVLKDSK